MTYMDVVTKETTVSEADREMTLQEVMEKLYSGHRARRPYCRLVERVRTCRDAYIALSKGEGPRTPLNFTTAATFMDELLVDINYTPLEPS